MNKCPQCRKVLTESVEVCKKCGFSVFEDVTKTLSLLDLDETKATKILSDKKMTPEKWQKIKGLFEAVQEISPEKRGKFLENACKNDAELKAEVEKLLSSFENAESFLENPIAAEVPTFFENKETLIANQTTGEIENGKFVAGTVLDNRYRIINLLGKGGMGEVYKAEDLKLNQTVALKFLPEKLEKNEDALKRFIGEVRTARRVSHQNVCKVFDIGDLYGKHFLSMEFIEGDDLSQLLRRIGRLPSDKATEISRQICFGLHAIHDAGILHRDLKPANVIIDSNGKARITDFGIAGIEADISKEEIRVGTPAYMSPEQITGKEVTTKSDIYSLGLLLYEIYTGKQAIQADSFEELLEKQKTTQPTNPSEFVENIDPIVEKTINRCLEKNPSERPKSALHVALALPGGNPLEAAIAAGETPSPEMVAAAPKKGALKPLVALGVLVIFIATAFAIIALNINIQVYSHTPFDKSPDILAEKSREMLKRLGYNEKPIDINYDFVEDKSFLKYYGFVWNPHNLPPRKELLLAGQPYDIHFLYRQSPKYLVPVDSVKVTENEPPLLNPNMANVKLDVRGRLIEFVIVPTQINEVAKNSETDWKMVFDEAGLDLSKFKETEFQWTPPVFADKTKAWEGGLADFPEIPIRVETAEFRGRPVYFRIVYPWHSEMDEVIERQNLMEKGQIGIALLLIIFALAIVGSSHLAYRNIRVGRGDLRSSLKLTLILFFLSFVGQLINADHVPTIWGELSIIYEAVSYAGIISFVVGILYIALEPFVRRSWSEMLISWSRLMAGDFRDPMVGRDILVGGLMGFGHLFGIHLGFLLVQFFLNKDDLVLPFYFLEPLNGFAGLFERYLNNIVTNAAMGLFAVVIALFFYLITKKKYLGIISVGFLFFLIQLLIFIPMIHWLFVFSAIFNAVCLMVALGRHGLLGMISFWFFFEAIYEYPITFDTSSFYFPQSMLMVVILFGLASYAYYISIAGQPIFGGKILNEFED